MAETDRTMKTRFGSLLERTSASSRPLLDRLLRSLSGVVGTPRSHRATAGEVIALCRQLLSERGERSGARLATEVVDAYRSLDVAELGAFLDNLARDFAVDPAAVDRAAEAYKTARSSASLAHLQQVVESPRQELFRRLNVAPGGIAALLDLRRRLLITLREQPAWADIDVDLTHLFRSWFNRGFLELRRLDWRTSAVILERLIHYEAVHQIKGWNDLRRRLDVDRRCYAFFHPALPDEPLIFIEIALTRGVPGAIQPLLDPEAPIADPSTANSAIFYSITNCQDGLRGISFGSFLIKQVVDDLTRSLPGLRTFATLSPMPGFVDWLKSAPASPWPLSAELQQALARVVGDGEVISGDVVAADTLKDEVSRLAAYYLLHVKRGEAPLDAVARFHLANGARLDRLNWRGDVSPTGLRRSLGLTVNYVYDLSDLEKNHQAYADEFQVIASRELQRLGEPPAAPSPRRRVSKEQ